jgi:hypothetical protein
LSRSDRSVGSAAVAIDRVAASADHARLRRVRSQSAPGEGDLSLRGEEA